MPAAISNRVRSVHADRPQGAALRIVPIVGVSQDEPEYRLLSADTLPAVKITEVSEGGSVPTLKVENELPTRLFLIDGQELVGAKQNRILNTDVLVPAKSELTIPVSCVEQNRWAYRSRAFAPGKSASHKIREAKSARVHRALKASGQHNADQGKVWEEVEESLTASHCASPTMALSDAYAKRDAEFASFRANLKLPAEAVGLAVFHGSKLRGIDVFDRATTLEAFWSTLLDSYAMDFLGQPPDVEQQPAEADLAEISSALTRAAEAEWEAFAPPGEGKDWRMSDEKLSGSALVWEERVVVHLQLFPRA